MAKSTADRFDFLMKLTNTQNTALARALNFDASYISRIRSGKRGLPPSEPFIEPAAAYFARHIREEYQKAAVLNELRLHRAWPSDERAAAALLAAWLSSEPSENPVERVIAAMREGAPRMGASEEVYSAASGSKAETALYYGNEGKRGGVIAFLSALCESGEPHTLLLTSDEDMAWLFEDAAFAGTWASLMGRLIQSGSRVRIIHSVSRDANEMWEAVQKWLPLYMSGAIEPYYYPRLRDGVYRRTLFIASGHSALCAASVQGQAGEELNLLLTDETAVKSLEEEFSAYLALCRPLMEIARPKDGAELAALLRTFADAPGKLTAAFPEHTSVCVKERYGALVVRDGPPGVAFLIKEPRMASAVEEYLKNLPDGTTVEDAQAVEALEQYLKAL